MDEILKSDNYEITMTDCNNKTVKLPKEAVKELFNRWTELSDNGPWTGNNDICYTKVIISFENNNVIQEREILLVDENTLVLNLNEESKYYTNSSGINNYLNELFTKNQKTKETKMSLFTCYFYTY